VKGAHELPRLVATDEARQRLFEDFVFPESEELRDCLVREEDLAWRSETKTGSGALAMIRFASRSFIVQLHIHREDVLRA